MPPKAPEQPSWRSRMLDMPGLVEAHDPHAVQPWVVQPLIIDAMLGIVAGKGGLGKTWVIHEAANAVARGISQAGMQAPETKPVLIVDAEMGEWLTVDRFKRQGYSTDIHVMSAVGMDLKANQQDRQDIWDAAKEILMPRGGLLVVDSLRAIVPSAKENDSDDMGAVVTWVRQVCRTTGAAGLLVHHAGWREDRTRGSSAIKDQADIVWYLAKPGEDDTLKLTCRGADLKPPRWGAPPPDLYLRIKPEGGLETADAPREHSEVRREAILEAIRTHDITNVDQLCELCGVAPGNPGVRAEVRSLRTSGEIFKNGALFRVLEPVGEDPTI